MIKRELAKDPKLKDENWERFLPKFTHKNLSKRKEPKKKKIKKPYTPFPPPMPESKVDKELASGEYFMREADRKAKKYLDKKEKQIVAAKVREEKRNASFVPPAENPDSSSKAKQDESTNKEVDVEKLKKKVKRLQNKMKKRQKTTSS